MTRCCPAQGIVPCYHVVPFVIVVGMLFVAPAGLCTAEIDSTWIGGSSGTWNMATNWLNSDLSVRVPNNTAGDQFNVRIDDNLAANAVVTLDTTPTVNTLRVDAGDALSIGNNRTLSIAGGLVHDDGTLTVLAPSTSGIARLNFLGDSILAGVGSVVLSQTGGINSHSRVMVASGTLTNAAGHTIRGGGEILVNTGGSMLNQGTIRGDLASRGITIDPADDQSFTNDGLVEATNGSLGLVDGVFTNNGTIRSNPGSISLGGTFTNNGIIASLGTGVVALTDNFTNAGTIEAVGTGGLAFSNLTLANTDRTISIADGSTLSLSGINAISGGAIVTANTGQVLIQNTSTNLTLNGVMLAATVNQKAGTGRVSAVTIHGGLSHTGTWTLAPTFTTSTFSVANLIFADGGMLAGAGEVVLKYSGTSVRSELGVQTGTLMHGAGHTIRGNGFILDNVGGSMVNQGTIRAEGGALTIDPADGQSFTNEGLLEATTGTLTLAGGGFTNNGTIRSQGSGTVTLADTLNNAGTIEATGTGGVIFSTLALTNTNRTIRVDDGSQLTLSGTNSITGGTIATSGTGEISIRQSTDLTLAGATLSGSVVQISGEFENQTTIHGSLTHDGDWTVYATTGRYESNYSTLQFVGDAVLSGNGEVVLAHGPFSPGRTAAARLLVDSGTLTNAAEHTIRGRDVILADAGGSLINEGTIIADTGALTIDPANGQSFTNQGTLRAEATLDVSGGTLTNLVGSELTGGAYYAAGTLRLPGDVTTNNAHITLDGASSRITSPTSTNALANLATIGAAGHFELRGARNLTTAAGLTNNGRITIGAGSTLTINGGYTPGPDSTTHVDGRLSATTSPIVVQDGAVFSGKGQVLTPLVVSNGGVVSPGASPGTLRTANLVFGDGAVLQWEISQVGADLVDVQGTLAFGSTATIRLPWLCPFPDPATPYVLFKYAATANDPVNPMWTVESLSAALDIANVTIAVDAINDRVVLLGLDTTVEPVPGDINLDCHVDRMDAALLAPHFGTNAGATWRTGDFNGDASTTLADAAILQMNLGMVLSSPSASIAVPEPGAIALVWGALFAWWIRHCRAGAEAVIKKA